MIIEEYDESLFISRFEDYKRITTSEHTGNFSYKGLRALYQYLDELSDDTEPYKLDVIALCCEYSEYADLKEYLENYTHDAKTEEETDEDFIKRIEEEINDKTTLIKFGEDLNAGFIILQY